MAQKKEMAYRTYLRNAGKNSIVLSHDEDADSRPGPRWEGADVKDLEYRDEIADDQPLDDVDQVHVGRQILNPVLRLPSDGQREPIVQRQQRENEA